jgi:hypothetical protein
MRASMKRAVILATLLAASACGGASLAERDSEGARACTLLNEALRNDGPATQQGVRDALDSANEAGEAAAASSTRAIRESIVGPEGSSVADLDELHEACEAEGVSMTPLP